MEGKGEQQNSLAHKDTVKHHELLPTELWEMILLLLDEKDIPNILLLNSYFYLLTVNSLLLVQQFGKTDYSKIKSSEIIYQTKNSITKVVQLSEQQIAITEDKQKEPTIFNINTQESFTDAEKSNSYLLNISQQQTHNESEDPKLLCSNEKYKILKDSSNSWALGPYSVPSWSIACYEVISSNLSKKIEYDRNQPYGNYLPIGAQFLPDSNHEFMFYTINTAYFSDIEDNKKNISSTITFENPPVLGALVLQEKDKMLTWDKDKLSLITFERKSAQVKLSSSKDSFIANKLGDSKKSENSKEEDSSEKEIQEGGNNSYQT